MTQFQWIRAQVSAKNNLLQPYVMFLESDPCPTVDCWFGLADRFKIVQSLPPLVPGKSGVVTVVKKAENESCRAKFKYAVRYSVVVDPVLSQPPQPPIVLDNQAPSFQPVGTWCVSNATIGVYGPDSEWSCNGNTGLRFRWTPTIPALAQYDVYIRFPTHTNRSTKVPFTIHHVGEDTINTFNQQTKGNDWRLHGRYMLSAGTGNFVEVSSGNGTGGADAVHFILVP